ncbi:hypothetical protein HJG60_008112 [Phyllostomus discolor]|uniref:Uncharacterized protein n=1 Tax=Phyllostomus discolor TaxID=89673 RepID=A0A834DQ15_9CHIR|nr:hypothetical protein HJG60_008112 [Phyllostomus discolor]
MNRRETYRQLHGALPGRQAHSGANTLACSRSRARGAGAAHGKEPGAQVSLRLMGPLEPWGRGAMDKLRGCDKGAREGAAARAGQQDWVRLVGAGGGGRQLFQSRDHRPQRSLGGWRGGPADRQEVGGPGPGERGDGEQGERQQDHGLIGKRVNSNLFMEKCLRCN